MGDKKQQEALIVWQQPHDYGSSIEHFAVQINTGEPHLSENTQWIDVYKERNLNREIYKLLLPLSPWVNNFCLTLAYFFIWSQIFKTF